MKELFFRREKMNDYERGVDKLEKSENPFIHQYRIVRVSDYLGLYRTGLFEQRRGPILALVPAPCVIILFQTAVDCLPVTLLNVDIRGKRAGNSY
jgi:hypothetical protein